MNRIALIGANGQLATDIIKVFNKDYFQITPLTHKDVEITDVNNTRKVLEEINPDIVINTAAYHKVDEVEDNP
jgi:dTDP-4-dehydrorhamnose reductase